MNSGAVPEVDAHTTGTPHPSAVSRAAIAAAAIPTLRSLPSDQPLPRRDVYYSNDPHSRGRTRTSRGPRHGVAIPPGMHRRLAAAPLGGSAASRAPSSSSAISPSYHARRRHRPRHPDPARDIRRLPQRLSFGRDVFPRRAGCSCQRSTCPSIGVSTHVRGHSTLPRRRFSPTTQSDS